MVLTRNQKKVLRLLAISSNRDYSINGIAKAVKVAPNGAYKILKKFGKEEILTVKKIANIKSYKLNLKNENTVRLLELAFSDVLEGRVKLRAEDFQSLRPITRASIVFGSYITSKQKPCDLDVLFILDKANFEQYKKTLAKVQDITPLKIHDVIQTNYDLLQNLKNNNPVIFEALKSGVVLWGAGMIVKVIRNAYR